MAFVVLGGAYAVYSLYASADAVRDRMAAHARLGVGRFPMIGVVTAALGALALFVLPALARNGGYPGNSAALVAVSLPLAAAALVVRAWGLARIADARSLGELLANYYGLALAALTAVPVVAAAALLLALVIAAAGSLIEILSARLIGSGTGIYLSALFVALTAGPAGIRAAGALARVQTAVVVLGIAALMWLIVTELGGPQATLAAMARAQELLGLGTTAGRGGGDYPAALAVAGALRSENGWNGLTVLSVQVGLVGTLLVLVWMPWSLAAEEPRQLARPLVGVASVVGGAALLVIGPLLGWTVLSIASGGAPAGTNVQTLSGGFADGVLATLINRSIVEHAWSGVISGLAALVALHALALALVAAAIGALRPLTGRRLRTARGTFRELAAVQAGAFAVVAAATVLAAATPGAEIVTWCEFALSLAVLAVLPVSIACWFPALTAGGLVAGLILGAVATALVFALADASPWYGPLLGLLVGAVSAVAATASNPRDSRKQRRLDAARQLESALASPGEERMRTPLLLSATLAWIFFAIGPGAVVGNDLFGAPDRLQRNFALPSIAVWQILCWASGVVLVWIVSRERAQLTREEARRLAALGTAAKAAQTDPRSADPGGTPDP